MVGPSGNAPFEPVTVVVVSFNTREELRRCLSAIDPRHQVVVIDNASSDGSPETIAAEFPHVKLVRNQHNRGFGAANNQGLALAKHEKALLLNSDATPASGAIEILAQAMQPGDVAAGGRLEFPDGRLQDSAANQLTLWRVFCEQTYLEKLSRGSKLFDSYWLSARLPQGGQVEQVMGACLMLRRIGGEFLRFDERIFLYCEDTELCRRLRRHGEIRYVPEAVFRHDLGASSKQARWQSVALYNRGKEIYFAIHHGPTSAFVCLMTNRLGAILRILAGGLVTAKARLFWRVLFARAKDLPQPSPLESVS